MDKKTKMYIGIGIGVVALLYFMRKPEEVGQIEEELDIIDSSLADEVETKVMGNDTGASGQSITIANSKNNSWIGIPSNQRNKATATLQIGTQGTINGTDPCTITDFWIDANGKKGAFRCDDTEYYEIPGGSTFKY